MSRVKGKMLKMKSGRMLRRKKKYQNEDDIDVEQREADELNVES